MIQEKIGPYEVYRIVTDTEALHEAFRDRAEDIAVPRLELDAAGKLQPGYSSKLLCNPPMKGFGVKSLDGMLKATGTALVMVIDDERFAPLRAKMSTSKRPMRRTVPCIEPSSPKQPEITEELQQKMVSEHMRKLGKMGNPQGKSNGAKKRMKTMSKRARQRAATHAARMRWSKEKSA